METNYVFDIDGTLTPARAPIEPEFKKYFMNWMHNKKVYLISGSDYPKSVEQAGKDLCEAVTGCFNTAGNTFYQNGQLIYKNDWNAPEALVKFLNELLKEDSFPIRAGRHFEHRIGMVNFSIIGRDCTRAQRNQYFEYDKIHQDRERYRRLIMEKFPQIEVSIGGQISIDIYPKSKNKGQVVDILEGPIHFFGDKTMEGGNDYDLAKRLQHPPHIVTQVADWKETYHILQEI